MKRYRAIVWIGLVGAFYCGSPVRAVSVLDSEGLSFSQLDLSFPNIAAQNDSQYGLAAVDINQLLTNKAMQAAGGYLNVATSNGWVVQNLKLDPAMLAAGMPGISMIFDLGENPGNVTSLSATADLSLNPVANFSLAGVAAFQVGALAHNAQGGVNTLNALEDRDGPVEHRVEKLTFDELGGVSGVFQPNHPSVEQRTNQCGPGALANSLQYLENRYGINVPHDLQPGGGGDNTLPGQIDFEMNRLPNRGVTRDQFLNGKLGYINNNGLGGPDGLSVKGYGIGGDRTVGNTTMQDQTVSSGLSLVDWILRELEHGEDVELWMDWVGGGAHLVNITGGGRILGVPYFTFVHDAIQNDNTRGTDAATGGVGFSYFDELRGNFINYIGDQRTNNATFRFAVSESVVPSPAASILGLAGFMLLSLRRDRRRFVLSHCSSTSIQIRRNPCD